jgi:hypothetical protein
MFSFMLSIVFLTVSVLSIVLLTVPVLSIVMLSALRQCRIFIVMLSVDKLIVVAPNLEPYLNFDYKFFKESLLS